MKKKESNKIKNIVCIIIIIIAMPIIVIFIGYRSLLIPKLIMTKSCREKYGSDFVAERRTGYGETMPHYHQWVCKNKNGKAFDLEDGTEVTE